AASALRPGRRPVSSIPASSPASLAPAVNGTAAAARAAILRSPDDIDSPAMPSSGVPESQAMPAAGAVVPSPAEGGRAQHGVDGPGTVGHELRLMPRPAGGPRATVSGIGRQQRLRHQAPQPGQP